ncbi:MAG: Dinitrogenase iron-molybdenum cofactor [Methanosaeta sp. PtaU1.Bin060]|jgi:predicted Fe-Mo cluster-binding NifX family protein|nr:MAG: Dinitrogenase iron-molybdenum cofactor [Methanosaeta sp. PtaU1.Bin060]
MKVCVTAGATGLEAPLDPRFGRCPFFVIVDLESMSENSVANNNAGEASGAGIQAAQTIARLGASALITGNIGPNALQTLSAANIDVYQQQGRSVMEAIEKFKDGVLMRISAPTRPAHSGMGSGGGPVGRGRGGGSGAGRGGGQGSGRGGGQGSGSGSGRGGGQGR